jgi:hypothetical protein
VVPSVLGEVAVGVMVNPRPVDAIPDWKYSTNLVAANYEYE